MQLLADESARCSLIYKRNSPIYTRVHNSAPTVYKSGAKVQGSMIADDCVIEGTVINSIICRNVYVAKGAVVKNCVLFSGTHIGECASLDAIVTDKNVYISNSVNLCGNKSMPFYIEKRRRI